MFKLINLLIRFGQRVQGPGKAEIQRLVLGSRGERPAAIIGQSPYLVLAKQSPAHDDLYRYGFLYSRVCAYKEHGLLVDVFRINNESGQVYSEFDGINIASGNAQLLDDTLRTGSYQHVLVHMLDEIMWRVLEPHLDKIKVTVWVHGAEIQVWQRRSFEFVNLSSEEIARQKDLSGNRVKFWQKIIKAGHPNLHLVFVSNYLKNEVITDSQLTFPDSSYSVISNFIDGAVFPYREKNADDRLKLLSIRPYAKRVYANDLTVAAIIELSKRSFFNELSFTLVGEGELFDETVAPVRNFTNVLIENRFLNHAEIAVCHQNHGVFLVPTRMDTQGVSRGEAMSSGLVPITTNVAAIPEFVDSSCGIVVPAEDYKAIADGIESLYHNPELFLSLSKAAMQKARRQCGFSQTIRKEMQLIQGQTKKIWPILIKADDLSLHSNFSVWKRLVKIVDDQRACMDIGFISSPSKKDSEFVLIEEFLSGIDMSRIEFFNHGVTHLMSEFKGREADQYMDSFEKSTLLETRIFGKPLNRFGAPFNSIDKLAVDTFRGIHPESLIYYPDIDDSFAAAGYGMAGNGFLLHKYHSSFERKDEAYNPSFDFFRRKYSRHISEGIPLILQIHPGRWGDNGFNEFKKILVHLEKNGAKFVSPDDFASLTCG